MSFVMISKFLRTCAENGRGYHNLQQYYLHSCRLCHPIATNGRCLRQTEIKNRDQLQRSDPTWQAGSRFRGQGI